MMQANKQGKKKHYRARGSRGGRRKKSSQHGQHHHTDSHSSIYSMNQYHQNITHANNATPYNDIDQYPTYMPMPIYISNNQFAHSHQNNVLYDRSHTTAHVNVQQYHLAGNYAVPNSNYLLRQNEQVDYSSLPPPLPLVQTSSSFSSQSSSTSYNTESFHSDVYSSQHVNNLVDEVSDQEMYNNHTIQTPVGLKREPLKLKNIDTTTATARDYWPSLFSISPRSFLMGKKSNN